MDDLPEKSATLQARVPDDMVETGRLYGGTFILAALGLGAFEYHSIQELGRFGQKSIFIVSFCGVMGIAALIQPGLLWSLSARRRELPRSIRYVGLSLAVLIGSLALGLVWVLKNGRLL